MMKIIVLGASGQIGSVIFEGLKSVHTVTGTSRRPCSGFVQFDPFVDNWSVLGKTDVLINCIGQIEETAQNSFHHIHVDLTKRIIANRPKLGNPRLVQISALGASSNHNVKFLKTKGMADDLLLQHNNTAVVRPSIVCTHRTMIVKKILMLSNLSRFFLGLVLVPKGFLRTRIQPIMPQDLVDIVHQVCISEELKIIDAAGAEALSFGELIQLVMRNGKRKFKVLEVAKTASDLIIKNILSYLLPGVISAQQYQLLFQDNVSDVEQCKQLLGRTPLSTRPFFEKAFHQQIR